MDTENLLGTMDLLTEASICMDANMEMAFLLLDLKNTIRVNGLMASKAVEAFSLIKMVLYFKKVFGKTEFSLEKLIEFIIMIVFKLNRTIK